MMRFIIMMTSNMYHIVMYCSLCDQRALLPHPRPKAVRLVSGVGSEEMDFEPAIPLEGKVEIYMQVIEDTC